MTNQSADDNWCDAAAQLLEAAWPVPALRYTAAGLNWQRGFPGAGPWVCLGETELIALGGATRRRARIGSGELRDLAIVSFVAVAGSRRGQGYGRNVYKKLLEELQDPVLTFSLAGSAGADLIEKAYPAAGYHLHSLADCGIYVRMTAKAVPPAGWKVEPLRHRPQSEAWGGVLVSDPPLQEWEHWALDPRPHAGWVASGPGTSGVEATIWCWLVEQQVRTLHGLRGQWVVESWGGTADIEAQAKGWEMLVWAAAQGGEDHPPIPLLQANNLSAIAPTHLRERGWRQTSTPFRSWLAWRDWPGAESFRASTLPLI